MLRSLEWAKGTLLHTQAADEIIHEVSDFIQEIQTSEPRAQDGKCNQTILITHSKLQLDCLILMASNLTSTVIYFE